MTTKPLTPARRAAILANYKSMREHYDKGKRLCFEAMSHPDITPEQLWEIHLVAARTHKTLTDVGNSLRALDGGMPSFVVHPWEKPL